MHQSKVQRSVPKIAAKPAKSKAAPHLVVLAAFSVIFYAGRLHASDWPRFLGPNGTAASEDAGVPTDWKDAVRWSVAVPGSGISSPVISAGRLYITFSNEDGSKRTLWSLDAKTGAEHWRRSHEMATHSLHKKNTFATSTPAATPDAVVCTFGDQSHYWVTAYSVDGEKRWQVDLGGFNGEHGAGGSPIIHNGLVVVVKEQDGESMIAAFDLQTGAERWRTPYRVKFASYSTPLVLGGADDATLVCSHSHLGLAGYQLKDGKRAWLCTGFSKRTVGSPTMAGGFVVATAGQGNSGHLLLAVDANSGGTERTPAYTTGERIPYCTSPIGMGDRLYFVTDMGVMRCMNAKTGEEVYTQRLKGKYSATPVRVQKQLYFVSEEGEITVVEAGDIYRRLASNKLPDYFLASPAVADGRMYLRGEKKLWCIGKE